LKIHLRHVHSGQGNKGPSVYCDRCGKGFSSENYLKVRGQFLNGFLRLREKLVSTLVLDLALFAPRRKVGAYGSFQKLASVVDINVGSILRTVSGGILVLGFY
jgi:hypothetical protein